MLPSIAVESIDSWSGNSSSALREDLIDEIFEWVYGLSNITDELSREIERSTGLSKNHALTLKAIARSHSVRVSELARSMYLNPATMVRILDRLEEQGLIVRVRSEVDRRGVEIGLTDKAKEVVLVLHTITHDNMMKGLAAMEERDLAGMLVTLHKLSSLLDAAYLRKS